MTDNKDTLFGDKTSLELKYNGIITLEDAYNDEKISSRMEKFYVPPMEITTSGDTKNYFIQKDVSIAISDSGPRRIRFIYLNHRGVNVTNPDSSYIQLVKVGGKCAGFLARMSISKSNFVPNSLMIDYLIDISKIKFRIDSEISTAIGNNGLRTAISHELIRFENMDFSEYGHLMFDERIREFSLNKESLFEDYFR